MRTHRCQLCTNARRGAVFHYYLLYVLIASILMSSAGVCLHAVLKADRIDEAASLFLKTLLRLEEQLRRDSRFATLDGDNTSLQYSDSENEQTIRWTIDENMILRQAVRDQAMVAMDRYVFRRGTRLEFRHDAELRLVALVLHEASAIPAPGQPPDASTAGIRTLEIRLPSRPVSGTSDADPEVSE